MNSKIFKSRRRLIESIVIFNILFALVICLALWNSYRQQLRYTEEKTLNMTLALERSLSGTLDQIEMLLVSMGEHIEEDLTERKKIDSIHLKLLINNLVQYVPGIIVANYSDASGNVAMNTGFPANSPAISIQDRDYFQLSRDNAGAGMVSSKPVLGRISGKWVIIFARHYHDPAGKFAGVMYASVELDHFNAMFAALKLGEDAAITLISDLDYMILTRYPVPQDKSIIGSRILEPFIDKMKAGEALATMLDTSKDGIQRSRTIRRLDARPYWIGVGLSAMTELAPWRQQVIAAMIVWIIFALLTAIAGWQMYRGWRRLEDTRSVLENTLEATDNAILVVGRNGKVIHSNRRFHQMWPPLEAQKHSNNEHELLGHAINELPDQNSILNGVDALLADSEAESFDHLELKDGRVLERASFPMLMNGKSSGRVWSFRDVTEQKTLEDKMKSNQERLEELVQQRTVSLMIARDTAERANRAKSVFLSNMSHELRTPLNAILGFAQLLNRNNDQNEESLRHLATINRAGQHLLSLINDVLEISRIEAGQIVIQNTPFNLPSMLTGVEELNRVRAEDKGLNFEVEYAADLPSYVDGDEHHLKQVLINLLGNAVKYTDRGNIRLQVSHHNGNVIFDVSDTGPGIAAEDQASIFEAFYQTEAGIAKGEGTGLGLAISKKYTVLMGGSLNVKSQLGQGSVFTLSIPLKEVQNQLEKQASGSVTGLEAGQEGLRVLVVDDVTANRELLKILMTMSGFEVRMAENGKQAVEIFQSWQPHFIWMDMRMPVLDGYQATRQIRSLPGGEQVKIVALTATAFAEEKPKILLAGCNDVVSKPFEQMQLFEVMRKQLGVRFNYAEVEAAKPTSSKELDLATLPSALRQTLGQAASALDLNVVRGSVNQIRELNPQLAAQLDVLVQGFRLDSIADLCKETGENGRT